MKTRKVQTAPSVPESQMQEFELCLGQGHEGYVKAGQILVAMLDKNPDIFEVLLKRNKTLKYQTLETLELIGRKKLLPELLLDTSMGAVRLSKMPYAMQEKLYYEPIEVVTKKKGVFKVERKRVSELTFLETFTALDSKGVVPQNKQQEYLAEHEILMKKKRGMRYLIDGDFIQFFARSKFNIVELHAMLSKIIEDRKPAQVQALQQTMQRNQVARPRMAA